MDSGDIDFVAAVRSIDLGETSGLAVGLDLDRRCTCQGEGDSCIYPPYATKDHCDGPDGRDSSASLIFKSLIAALGEDGFGSVFYSQMAEAGEWSLLVRVQGYNGQADDPKVKVSFYEAPGFGAAAQPMWDGSDKWPVSTSSLADMASIDKPLYFDDNAYVSQGSLVASFPSVDVRLKGADSYIAFRLTTGALVGSIQNPAVDQLGWRIVDGVLAGRWKMEDVFISLGTFKASGATFCNDGGFIYKTFKNELCGHIDIASTLGDATAGCDSISLGMKLQTHPAKLGPLHASPPPDATCPEDQNPASDACDL
jgi:hypothetical protein